MFKKDIQILEVNQEILLEILEKVPFNKGSALESIILHIGGIIIDN